MLCDLEADIAEREQMESSAFCSGFVEHFCRAEPAMSVEYEVKLCRAILEQVSDAQIKDLKKIELRRLLLLYVSSCCYI